MKKLNHISKAILAIAMMLLVALPSFAHDFEVDGIFYNYLDKTANTVEVTFKGSSYNSYSNEYTGSVTIPSTVTYDSTTYSVTSIGVDAFIYCYGLTSITIPNSVTSIGSCAFYGCTRLKTIVSLNPKPPVCSSSDSFYNYSSTTLYVPKDSYAKYFVDDVWGQFTNIKKIETLVSFITLNKSVLTIDSGSDYTLNATAYPSNATIPNFTWESDNNAVATVDQNGKVTGVSAGIATITVKANDGSNVLATCKVTVNNVTPSISLSQTEAILPINEIMTLSYTIKNSATKTATWSTSNANVAYVKTNSDGSATIVGMTEGEATITATIVVNSNEYSASCKVKIIGASISLSQSEVLLPVNQILKLNYTVVNYSSDEIATAIWNTSDANVAYIITNSDGSATIVGMSEGEATITATIVVNGNEYSASCKVEIIGASISLSQSEVLLPVDQSLKLNYTIVNYSSDEVITATWSTSDANVIYIIPNSDGSATIVGKKEGVAIITATMVHNGKEYSASCRVVVGGDLSTEIKNGITCKNMWIIDRVHNQEKFLDLPFVKEAGTKARTAVIDGKRGKIYIGYSKPVVVDSVSNDYAHLVVFDLETGKYEGEVALTCDGVPVSGLLCANQVGIDDAGNLWICGMYSNVCKTPAQIYVVTNRETGECKNVGQWALPEEESGAGGRCDYWDVVGDITGETSNAVCMAAVGATVAGEKLCIYRWELPQGETEWVANEDDFAGYVSYYDGLDTYPADQATWGSSSATVRIVAEEGHVGSMFYVDGFTTCPSLYLSSLSLAESFASAPDLAPAVGCNGVNEFVLGETPFLVYAEAQYNVSPGCRINVCQLGEGMTFEGMRKYWSLPEAGLGEVSDGGTRIHSIDTYKVVDKNGKEGVYLLTYKNFNGLGVYFIADERCSTSKIVAVSTSDNAIEVARYDIHGRLLSEPTPGINIVQYSDGTTRKLIIKN